MTFTTFSIKKNGGKTLGNILFALKIGGIFHSVKGLDANWMKAHVL
jgi:hypothetical protein